jgi:hypothetical protein
VIVGDDDAPSLPLVRVQVMHLAPHDRQPNMHRAIR